MDGTRTRIAISLSATVAVVASAAVDAPDAIDRALQRRTRTLGTTAMGTDAIARAIARRGR